MTTITANDETLQHILGLILSAKIPVPALLEVTRTRIEEEAVAEAEVLRQFLENRAASKEVLLAKAAGETLSVEAVAALLQIGTGGVHKAKDEDRILAYQEPGKRTYRFPTFQFDGAAVAPWVPELIQIVGNGFAALHFLTVERKSLKNQSYLSRIHGLNTDERSKTIEAMLEAARKLLP